MYIFVKFQALRKSLELGDFPPDVILDHREPMHAPSPPQDFHMTRITRTWARKRSRFAVLEAEKSSKKLEVGSAEVDTVDSRLVFEIVTIISAHIYPPYLGWSPLEQVEARAPSV